MTKKEFLEVCDDAIKNKKNIVVSVEIPGNKKYEEVFNSYEDVQNKKEYYDKNYDDNMKHLFGPVTIVGIESFDFLGKSISLVLGKVLLFESIARTETHGRIYSLHIKSVDHEGVDNEEVYISFNSKDLMDIVKKTIKNNREVRYSLNNSPNEIKYGGTLRILGER